MARKAKLRSTGEIVEVYAETGFSGTTYWIDTSTKDCYDPSELDFLPENETDKLSVKPTIADLISFDTPHMEYEPRTMTAQFIQNCHVRFNDELIKEAIKFATDEQLREGLKRRSEYRKLYIGHVLRCRDCIHCIQGHTSKSAVSRGYKTSVCKLKPKDKAGRDCFYSTLQSRRACVDFEPKEQLYEQTNNHHY